jgi:GABA permease
MHNPLRSEAEMFRLVVIIGLAAVPVIAIGLAVGPEWGAVILGIELGIGIGLIWHGSRGSLPREAEVPHVDDDVHRILVVANETVGGRALLDELRARSEGRKSEIFIVVPAITSSRLQHLAHDVDAALAEARTRLADSLATMSAAGLAARGEVGDHHDPNTAMEDALQKFPADELVISTHPPQRSRWLEGGVVERAREEIPLPVTHVVVDLEAEDAAAGTTA